MNNLSNYGLGSLEQLEGKATRLIRKPHELTMESKLLCMIYGAPAVGKTTLALSSPKPVLIDLDRGLHRVDERYHCDSLQVNNLDEITEVLGSSEIDRYETIVIDTLGKLVDQISDWACEKNPKLKQYDGTLNIKAWGIIKLKFSELLRDMRRLNKHLIFVAHEKEETFDNIVRKRPDVSGSAGKDIMKELDLMGYMHISNKKRVISFTPDDNYYAKNCFGLDPIIEIPSRGNDFISDVLLRKIEEKRILGSEMAEHYHSLVKSHEVEIDDANTVDEINQAYERLTQSPKVWDSELCWKQRLQNKCKSIGVIYNKDLGQFVSRENAPQPAA